MTDEKSKIVRALKSTRDFTDNRHKALMGTLLLFQQLDTKRQAFYKSYNITSQQYNVLRILRGQYPKAMTMQHIRSRMIDKMSDVSRLVERLLKMELVTRDSYEHDKRIVNVYITQQGLDLLAEIDKHIHINWAFSNVSDAEIEQFITIVEKMLD